MTRRKTGGERAKEKGNEIRANEREVFIMGKYSEVSLEVNGYDNGGMNSLAKRFQYEYALYTVVSGLFSSVVCRSMCIDSLELYFSELPHSKEDGKKRMTQESLLDEMRTLVERDVIGSVIFPQMNICAAEAAAIPEEDGSHTFVFSDGIYGFAVHYENAKKKKPRHIKVEDRRAAGPAKKKGVKEDAGDNRGKKEKAPAAESSGKDNGNRKDREHAA